MASPPRELRSTNPSTIDDVPIVSDSFSERQRLQTALNFNIASPTCRHTGGSTTLHENLLKPRTTAFPHAYARATPTPPAQTAATLPSSTLLAELPTPLRSLAPMRSSTSHGGCRYSFSTSRRIWARREKEACEIQTSSESRS